MNEERDGINPDDYPNDYSNPRAIESDFAGIKDRLNDLEGQVKELKRDRGGYVWAFGSAVAIVLSWSRNASILYCIGHGIASWIYVIYFAATR